MQKVRIASATASSSWTSIYHFPFTKSTTVDPHFNRPPQTNPFHSHSQPNALLWTKWLKTGLSQGVWGTTCNSLLAVVDQINEEKCMGAKNLSYNAYPSIPQILLQEPCKCQSRTEVILPVSRCQSPSQTEKIMKMVDISFATKVEQKQTLLLFKEGWWIFYKYIPYIYFSLNFLSHLSYILHGPPSNTYTKKGNSLS